MKLGWLDLVEWLIYVLQTLNWYSITSVKMKNEVNINFQLSKLCNGELT